MIFKIIVVDDEPLIARSIATILQKANSAFQISCICYNGQEALTKIKEIEPDLVFSDIKMPIMDGLELAHEMRIHFPTIRMIILSGYNEFSYAQKAIHEGVTDYLLKPLNREKVSILLESLKKELELTVHTKQLELWNKLTNHSENNFFANEIEKYLPYKNYMLFLTCCGPYFHSTSTPSKTICAFWSSNFIFQNCWNLLSDIPFWIIDCTHPNEKLIIICTDSRNNSIDITNNLHQAFCNNNFPITSVVYQNCSNLFVLSKHLRTMNRHLKNHLILGQSTFILVEETTKLTSKELPHLSSEQKKYASILFQERQNDKLYKLIHTQLHLLHEKKCPQVVIEEFLKDVIGVILATLNRNDAIFLYHNSIYDITASSYELSYLEKAFISLLADLFLLQDSLIYENMPQNITAQQIKTYIEDHYSEPINIQTLSAHFGFVAPYISKLYYDYYHCSLKSDILKMRIIKAEELLQITPPLPLRQIAELTGFNDPFYFSKVFKQQRAMSPVDFRKHINKSLT